MEENQRSVFIENLKVTGKHDLFLKFRKLFLKDNEEKMTAIKD